MVRRISAILLVILMIAVLPECAANTFQPVDQLQPAVTNSLSEFSIDLFRRLAVDDSGKNVLISPLSVWLALGMTYNGASGSTADGMAKALHAVGVPIDDLNNDNKGLLGVLASADPKVQISIANSIWLGRAYEKDINQNFLQVNRNSFGAGVQVLDFTKSNAAETMNKWVNENTGGKIVDIIQPPIDPNTVMYLIDAVYFNAPWSQAFDPNATRDGLFTQSNGSTVQVRYMFHREDNLGYADDTMTAVRLPYASGRLEMVALMPVNQAVQSFIRELTPDRLQSYIDQCSDSVATLTFPMFKMEYEAELKTVLSQMGMKDAFEPLLARFEKMSTTKGDSICLSNVLHKSFIDVNVSGTKAVAAVAVVATAAATAPPKKDLNFTKPFVYLIRDTKTGAILFIGTMENPS